MKKQIVNPSIFRAYDIRGVVDETLTIESVYAIGRSIGTVALECNEESIAVARDGRLSGPALMAALCDGIRSTGCNVINLGMVPTPVLYFAAHVLETQSGVMLTGSHNPPNYNGLKIVIQKKTLAEEQIQDLYHRIIENRLRDGKGRIQDFDITERYLSQIANTVKLNKPLKVVIDCGNGVPGMIAPELFSRLGCEVHELFCHVDGNFPNHHPDPSQTENLQDLIRKVREIDADVGLAFDGDGDRLGVVTKKGNVIWPDRQLILLAKSILAKNPGAKIIYDVKCTSNLDAVIRAHGGEPIMWKTGHSLIKAKLAETKALLAGEMSGHLFLKDRWYGFDDALYAGARLLEILAAEKLDIDGLFEQIPDSVNTPELKIKVTEDNKFFIMEKLVDSASFDDAEINTIDGLRVNFADGWGLVRPSNTTPYLVLRFEAISEKVLTKIQSLFRDLILGVDPSLELPF